MFFIYVFFNIFVYYSVYRMDFNMSDSELAALFDDLADVLASVMPSTAAAYGEPILPSVYDVYSWTDKHFVLY